MKKAVLLFAFISSLLISYSQTQEIDKEIYDKYINNSLENGSAPYADCYGINKHCPDPGCSEISIKTPSNSDESFGKDDPQELNNSILEYELILQTNGNFSTIPSNPAEAF